MARPIIHSVRKIRHTIAAQVRTIKREDAIMGKILLPFLVPLFVFWCFPLAALRYYVAPDGDDGNPGTKVKPFATLDAARDAVRGLKEAKALPQRGATVCLREGDYLIARTFELHTADSGTEKAPIIYRAYRREAVRLVGGRAIEPSAFVAVRDSGSLARLPEASWAHVLQADLAALGVTGWERIGLFPVDDPANRERPFTFDLYFNGEPMTLARWPNQGYARFAKVIERGPAPREGETGETLPVFEYDGMRPSRWVGASDYWLHGYLVYDWYDEHVAVKAIDAEKQRITLVKPGFYGIGGYGESGSKYCAMNLLEELDAPGEYYIDRRTGVLYFWPPSPTAEGRVIVATFDQPLIRAKDASNVVIRGMTFEASRGHGIQIEGGSNVLIAGCTLRNLSQRAIVIRGGAAHGVLSCDLYNLGRGGILLSGGDVPTLTPGRHYAVNNHIHHFGMQHKTYVPAINIEGVGSRAVHNRIHDAPHMALGYFGNDHVIELNEFFDVCLESDDAGCIYTGRTLLTRGNTIRHNFFHDIKGRPGKQNHGAFMIYLDYLIAGETITGNVFCDGSDRAAIFLSGGLDHTVTNNIFVNVGAPVLFSSWGLTWCADLIPPMVEGLESTVDRTVPPWSVRFPRLAEYELTQDWLAIPKGNVVANNVMVQTDDVALYYDPQVPADAVVQRNNWRPDHDPFADIEKHDFRFKRSAAINKRLPEFRTIPLRKIGLYRDAYRRALSRTPR